MGVLRERLSGAVKRQLQVKLERAVERMRDAVTPYNRFVDSELSRMKVAGSILSRLNEGARSLKEDIYPPSMEIYSGLQ